MRRLYLSETLGEDIERAIVKCPSQTLDDEANNAVQLRNAIAAQVPGLPVLVMSQSA